MVLHDNFCFVLFLPVPERVFDRNFNNEIFLRVFICVSLQPRNSTPDDFDETCSEVLFIIDPDNTFECATIKISSIENKNHPCLSTPAIRS